MEAAAVGFEAGAFASSTFGAATVGFAVAAAAGFAAAATGGFAIAMTGFATGAEVFTAGTGLFFATLGAAPWECRVRITLPAGPGVNS